MNPKRMQMQHGLNIINAAKQNQVAAITRSTLPAPAPAPKLSARNAYRRERVIAKQAAKRKAMPLFSEDLLIPPIGYYQGITAFAVSAKAVNPSPSCPEVAPEVLAWHEERHKTDIIYPEAFAGTHDPDLTEDSPPSSGATATYGEPAPETDTDELKAIIKAALAKRDKGARLKLIRRYRNLNYKFKAQSREAFATALANTVERTKARQDGYGARGTDTETPDKQFLKFEIRAIYAVNRFLEDILDKPVPMYKANRYKAAKEAFHAATKQVHTDPNTPVTFGKAPARLAAVVERAYYAMAVKAGVKKVIVCGGKVDGQVLPIHVAAKLKSYEVLLPAIEDDSE